MPGGETKQLETIIRMGVMEALFNVHTSMPGRVVSVNKKNSSLKVQPVLKRRFEGEEPVNLPVVNGVPLVYPSSGKYKIKFPVEVGDYVLLCFSERSVDKWKSEGGVVDPEDYRKFNLSDAFAIPGGKPLTENGAMPDNFEIEGPAGKIKFDDDGKFSVDNGANELIALLVELLEKLIAAQVITGIGPQNFFASTVSDFQQLKTKLETFKL